MILAHRIHLDPTEKQKKYFVQACGTARFVWNWALAEWNDQYQSGGKPKATQLKRYFNSVKYEKWPWMKDIHRDAHSRPFAKLSVAFSNFFAGRAKYPKFKKKGKCRDSFYVANDKLTVGPSIVRLPIIGRVRLTEELRFTGKIMSATVSREADRWFISISVDTSVVRPLATGEAIGIDLGLTTFATLSTGEKIEAPKPLKKALRRLRKLGRWQSRKQLKSANRSKATMKLSRQHRKVANVRKDFLHKLTTRLASEHTEICIEDLNVSGMSKNHNLALHIQDASWSEFRRQLEYKTAMYGSTLTVRDRYFASSKLCSVCGHKAESMPLSVRTWTCGNCGTTHDRDINAAKNLVKPTTAGFAGRHALGDRGADIQTTEYETAVVERGTKPGYSLVLTN